MKLNIIDLLRCYYLNKDFKKTKDCPTEDILYKYTFSLLPQYDVDLFEKHLKNCSYCSKKLAEISIGQHLEEKINEIQEDKELTEKIYSILQKCEIQPKRYLILKKIEQTTTGIKQKVKSLPIFRLVNKSTIFEEELTTIPTIKQKLQPSAAYSFLTFPTSEELNYKIKYKNITGSLTIKPVSYTELEISFKNLPKDTEIKIDTQTKKVTTETEKIKFTLPLKEKYEVVLYSHTTGQQLQFDIYME